MHYKPAKMSRQMPGALLTGPGTPNYSGDDALTLLCPLWLNGKQETSSGATEDCGSRGERVSSWAKCLQLFPSLWLWRFREVANSPPALDYSSGGWWKQKWRVEKQKHCTQADQVNSFHKCLLQALIVTVSPVSTLPPLASSESLPHCRSSFFWHIWGKE